MTLELTIQDMFDNYPTIFRTREECYNHLFCVIGNGMEWVNGEIVKIGLNDPDIELLTSHLVDGKAYQHNLLDTDKKLYQYYAENDEDESRRKRWREAINTASEEPEDLTTKWYGLSRRYSLIFECPKDIKPDWAKAVEECFEMLKRDGVKVRELD